MWLGCVGCARGLVAVGVVPGVWFSGGGCVGLGGLRGLYRFRAGLFWGSAAK